MHDLSTHRSGRRYRVRHEIGFTDSRYSELKSSRRQETRFCLDISRQERIDAFTTRSSQGWRWATCSRRRIGLEPDVSRKAVIVARAVKSSRRPMMRQAVPPVQHTDQQPLPAGVRPAVTRIGAASAGAGA
jgi:hypothetical protein